MVTRLQQAKPTIENTGLESYECINVGKLNHLLKLEKCTNLRQKVKLSTYSVKHNAIKKATWRYSSVFLTLHLTEVRGQLNVPTALYLRKQWYPSRRWLGWPQSRSQRDTEEKISSTGNLVHRFSSPWSTYDTE